MYTEKRCVGSDILDQLAQDVSRLPAEYRSPLMSKVERLREVQGRRKRILDLMQEALDQMRLDAKYLIFDLECTRRERDEARSR